MTNSPNGEQGSLAQLLLQGDKRALARAITLVESDDPRGWKLVSEVYPHTGRATVIGLTGPPGAGKSTLIAGLTATLRSQGRTVAVLSIDPTSPFTNGALLGDRIRLSEHFLDPGVFIRSMATRGALGGLSAAALQTVLLMDAAGAEVVLIETVGVGQGEVDIVEHADTVVLVLMPASGDSIQALKAGVMEIPDVIVVNKADQPLADAFMRELKGTLTLGRRENGPVPPVIRTEAINGSGLDALLEELAGQRQRSLDDGTLTQRRRRHLRSEVLALATGRIRRELELVANQDHGVGETLDRVTRRELDPGSAAAELVKRRDQLNPNVEVDDG